MLDFENDYEPGMEDNFNDNNDQIPLKYLTIPRETKLARLVVFEIVSDSLKPVQEWIPKTVSALGSPGVIWVDEWFVEKHDLFLYAEE